MSDPIRSLRSRGRLFAAAALVLATAGAGAVLHARPAATTVDTGGAAVTVTAPRHGRVTLGATLDRTRVLAGQEGMVRMEVVAGAEDVAGAVAVRQPTDLVVVLDRSGSMAGDKIVHARAALRALVQGLARDDRFALVTYSDHARLELPLAPAAPEVRGGWLALVEGVAPGGGTNLAAGLDLGLDTVAAARRDGRVPRVILISDGLANQGDATPQGLRTRAARAARGEFALSTVGVGIDFDEALMASLADAGTGNYHYVESAHGLDEIFADEFATARETVAHALELVVTPASGVELAEAAGYPIAREGAARVVRPGSLFAGQERRFWITFRVAAGAPGTQPLGGVELRYRGSDGPARITLPKLPELARVEGEREYLAGFDRDGWARSVVVEGYHRMQERVASHLKDGHRDEAKRELARFREEVGALNAELRSDAVTQRLEAVDSLEEELDQALAAPAPERARAAKELQAEAWVGARPGSRK